jgi:hypothetical protein
MTAHQKISAPWLKEEACRTGLPGPQKRQLTNQSSLKP